MKHRYIVRTYVDADSIEKALRLAKKTSPHDAFLDQDVWKEQGWTLKEADNKPLGFKS